MKNLFFRLKNHFFFYQNFKSKILNFLLGNTPEHGRWVACPKPISRDPYTTCGHKICPVCFDSDVEGHKGKTCEQWKEERDFRESQDGQLQAYKDNMASMGIIACPECGAGVRRQKYCNHIACVNTVGHRSRAKVYCCQVCGDAVTLADKYPHFTVKVNGGNNDFYAWHDVCKGLIAKETADGTYTEGRGFERSRGGGKEIPVSKIHASFVSNTAETPFTGTFAQLYDYVSSKYLEFERSILEVRDASGRVICRSRGEKPGEQVPADAVVKLFSCWDQSHYDRLFR